MSYLPWFSFQASHAFRYHLIFKYLSLDLQALNTFSRESIQPVNLCYCWWDLRADINRRVGPRVFWQNPRAQEKHQPLNYEKPVWNSVSSDASSFNPKYKQFNSKHLCSCSEKVFTEVHSGAEWDGVCQRIVFNVQLTPFEQHETLSWHLCCRTADGQKTSSRSQFSSIKRPQLRRKHIIAHTFGFLKVEAWLCPLALGELHLSVRKCVSSWNSSEWCIT